MRWILAMLAALMLSPALASDFGWKADIAANRQFPKAIGFVAIHLVTNLEIRYPSFRGWYGLRVERIDGGGRSYQLPSSTEGISSGQIFSGALPAGLYKVTVAVGYYEGLTMPVPAELSRFRVEPGRLTDVGSLALYLQPGGTVERGVFSSSFPTINLRLPARPGLLAWFRLQHPRLAHVQAAQYDPDAMEDAVDADGERPLGAPADFRNLAGIGIPRPLADGAIAAPGRMGQIRLRSAKGEWATVETAFTADITDLLPIKQGLLVVGDRGLVAIGHRDARTWETFPGIPANQSFYWVARAPDGAIYALSHSHKRALLVQLLPRQLAWKAVASFGYPRGFRAAPARSATMATGLPPLFAMFSGQAPTRPGVLAIEPDGLRIAVGRQRYFYRFEDSSLQQQPGGPYLASVHAQPNGVLLANSGKDLAVLYSVDGGREWKDFRRPTGAGDLNLDATNAAIYVTAAHELSLIAPRIVLMNHRNTVTGAQKYFQVGLEPTRALGWKPIAPMPTDCDLLLSTISTDAALYVYCHDQRVMLSRDLGQSWQLDRPAPAAPQSSPPPTPI
jgi:hypothetical protein